MPSNSFSSFPPSRRKGASGLPAGAGPLCGTESRQLPLHAPGVLGRVWDGLRTHSTEADRLCGVVSGPGGFPLPVAPGDTAEFVAEGTG